MGKKVGLALGAGSTKGFAHIGVLQTLEKYGVPIDAISGSSMGAIIGSIYAAGSDMRMLEKFLLTLNVRDYLDVKNPWSGGLLGGDRLEMLIQILTHDKTFEQANIPFCCVAVDAQNGRLDVLEHGAMYEAVRASMSIPAVFRPKKLNGKTYIDGGVMERVPCRVLRDRGMDVVIAVDVGYHGNETDVSGMNAYQLMNHTISIMTWEITKLREEDADITLVPEVLYVKGHFQMDKVAETIAEGRRVTEEAMPRIRRMIGME